MKSDYGLYRHIRAVASPSYRIGDFYATHLLGGPLDYADLTSDNGALPVVTENDATVDNISTLWRSSQMADLKDVIALRGSTMGDYVIRVTDIVEDGLIRLDYVDPSTVTEIERASHGSVSYYRIDEYVTDPLDVTGNKSSLYTETCELDGIYATFRTFRDNKLYDWGNGAAEWTEPYGFVPLVIGRHRNVGNDWGWAEIFPILSQIREIDDVASKTADQIRKLVAAPMLLSGVEKPDPRRNPNGARAGAGISPSVDGTVAPGREDFPIFYGPPGSSATPMVANLSIADAIGFIAKVNEIIERDYPELRVDATASQGSLSGRALRTSRQAAETKVVQRRGGYDAAIIEATKMGVKIGQMRGYDGYAGSTGNDIDFTIAARPVFRTDPLDTIEVSTAFWQAALAAQDAGCPLDVFLENEGWTEEQIARVTSSEHFVAKQASASGIG
jgi:hypothetical protein